MEGILYKILTIIFLLYSGRIWAQDGKDFIYFNEVTYDYYLKEAWNQLIQAGNEALDLDYDFYYLRARLGIAYYEKGIYTTAIRHFIRALKYNSSDPIILEYLYYAYIYASRYQDAALLYYQNKPIMKDLVLTFNPRLFDAMTIDVVYKMSDHHTNSGTEAGDIQYGQIGLRHTLGSHILLYHFASTLNHTFLDIAGMDNSRIRYQYHFYQFEYYAHGRINLGKGFEINPVFHFIGVDAYSRRYNDLYYSLGLGKRMGRLALGLQCSYAEINDSTLVQWVPWITYYPFGNNKFYLSTIFIFGSGDVDQQVYQGRLGVRLFRNTWMEGFMASGRSQYIALFDGAIIYNNPDYLLSRTGLSFTQYLTGKTSLTLHYALEKKEQIVSGDSYTHHVVAMRLNFKF